MRSWTKLCFRQLRRVIPCIVTSQILITLGISHAQQPIAAKKQIVISVDQFRLLTEGKDFFLQPTASEKKARIRIPREWLIAPTQEKDEEEAPVSSYHYDSHVTSFPIGNGEIGLRFSSYDMMTDGSLQASGGRDVFLIYDPANRKLRPGNVDFGITKQRYREDGCWHATMTHFLIADANADGLADIGAVKEQIRCPDADDAWEGQFYEQHALRWYLYTADGWKLKEGPSPWSDSYSELPLIGIVLSPVDYVGHGLWRTYDPTFWKNPPHYLPEYRKKMIAEQSDPKSE